MPPRAARLRIADCRSTTSAIVGRERNTLGTRRELSQLADRVQLYLARIHRTRLAQMQGTTRCRVDQPWLVVLHALAVLSLLRLALPGQAPAEVRAGCYRRRSPAGRWATICGKAGGRGCGRTGMPVRRWWRRTFRCCCACWRNVCRFWTGRYPASAADNVSQRQHRIHMRSGPVHPTAFQPSGGPLPPCLWPFPLFVHHKVCSFDPLTPGAISGILAIGCAIRCARICAS